MFSATVLKSRIGTYHAANRFHKLCAVAVWRRFFIICNVRRPTQVWSQQFCFVAGRIPLNSVPMIRNYWSAWQVRTVSFTSLLPGVSNRVTLTLRPNSAALPARTCSVRFSACVYAHTMCCLSVFEGYCDYNNGATMRASPASTRCLCRGKLQCTFDCSGEWNVCTKQWRRLVYNLHMHK